MTHIFGETKQRGRGYAAKAAAFAMALMVVLVVQMAHPRPAYADDSLTSVDSHSALASYIFSASRGDDTAAEADVPMNKLAVLGSAGGGATSTTSLYGNLDVDKVNENAAGGSVSDSNRAAAHIRTLFQYHYLVPTANSESGEAGLSSSAFSVMASQLGALLYGFSASVIDALKVGVETINPPGLFYLTTSAATGSSGEGGWGKLLSDVLSDAGINDPTMVTAIRNIALWTILALMTIMMIAALTNYKSRGGAFRKSQSYLYRVITMIIAIPFAITLTEAVVSAGGDLAKSTDDLLNDVGEDIVVDMYAWAVGFNLDMDMVAPGASPQDGLYQAANPDDPNTHAVKTLNENIGYEPLDKRSASARSGGGDKTDDKNKYSNILSEYNENETFDINSYLGGLRSNNIATVGTNESTKPTGEYSTGLKAAESSGGKMKATGIDKLLEKNVNVGGGEVVVLYTIGDNNEEPKDKSDEEGVETWSKETEENGTEWYYMSSTPDDPENWEMGTKTVRGARFSEDSGKVVSKQGCDDLGGNWVEINIGGTQSAFVCRDDDGNEMKQAMTDAGRVSADGKYLLEEKEGYWMSVDEEPEGEDAGKGPKFKTYELADFDGTEEVSTYFSDKSRPYKLALNAPETYLYGGYGARSQPQEASATSVFIFDASSDVSTPDGPIPYKEAVEDSDMSVWVAQNIARAAWNKKAGASGNNLSNQSMVFLLQSSYDLSSDTLHYASSQVAGSKNGRTINAGKTGYTYQRYAIPYKDEASKVGKLAVLEITWLTAGWASIIGLIALVTCPLLGALWKMFRGFFKGLFTGDIFSLVEYGIYFLAMFASFAFFAIGTLFGIMFVRMFSVATTPFFEFFENAGSELANAGAGMPPVASEVVGFFGGVFGGLLGIIGVLVLSIIICAFITVPIVTMQVNGGTKKMGVVSALVSMPYIAADALCSRFDQFRQRLYGTSSDPSRVSAPGASGAAAKALKTAAIGGAAGLAGTALAGGRIVGAGKDVFTNLRRADEDGNRVGVGRALAEATRASGQTARATMPAAMKAAGDVAKNAGNAQGAAATLKAIGNAGGNISESLDKAQLAEAKARAELHAAKMRLPDAESADKTMTDNTVTDPDGTGEDTIQDGVRDVDSKEEVGYEEGSAEDVDATIDTDGESSDAVEMNKETTIDGDAPASDSAEYVGEVDSNGNPVVRVSSDDGTVSEESSIPLSEEAKAAYAGDGGVDEAAHSVRSDVVNTGNVEADKVIADQREAIAEKNAEIADAEERLAAAKRSGDAQRLGSAAADKQRAEDEREAMLDELDRALEEAGVSEAERRRILNEEKAKVFGVKAENAGAANVAETKRPQSADIEAAAAGVSSSENSGQRTVVEEQVSVEGSATTHAVGSTEAGIRVSDGNTTTRTQETGDVESAVKDAVEGYYRKGAADAYADAAGEGYAVGDGAQGRVVEGGAASTATVVSTGAANASNLETAVASVNNEPRTLGEESVGDSAASLRAGGVSSVTKDDAVSEQVSSVLDGGSSQVAGGAGVVAAREAAGVVRGGNSSVKSKIEAKLAAESIAGSLKNVKEGGDPVKAAGDVKEAVAGYVAASGPSPASRKAQAYSAAVSQKMNSAVNAVSASHEARKDRIMEKTTLARGLKNASQIRSVAGTSVGVSDAIKAGMGMARAENEARKADGEAMLMQTSGGMDVLQKKREIEAARDGMKARNAEVKGGGVAHHSDAYLAKLKSRQAGRVAAREEAKKNAGLGGVAERFGAGASTAVHPNARVGAEPRIGSISYPANAGASSWESRTYLGNGRWEYRYKDGGIEQVDEGF